VATAGTAVFVVQDQRVRHERAIAEAARSGDSRVQAIRASPDLVVRQEPLTTGGRVPVAAVTGLAGRWRRGAAPVGVAALGGVGAAAALSRPAAIWFDGVPAVLAALVAAGCSGGCYAA
jgi:hypothetical protein